MADDQISVRIVGDAASAIDASKASAEAVHLREVKKAFGKSIAPRQVMVRSHSRKVDLPERSFLRSALHELEASGAIREEIEAAIGRAAAK